MCTSKKRVWIKNVLPVIDSFLNTQFGKKKFNSDWIYTLTSSSMCGQDQSLWLLSLNNSSLERFIAVYAKLILLK